MAGAAFRCRLDDDEQSDGARRALDEQVRGPFAAFRHEHRFLATEHGTEMVDDVAFSAPLGRLGRAVEDVFLAAYLERLLTARALHLKAALEK